MEKSEQFVKFRTICEIQNNLFKVSVFILNFDFTHRPGISIGNFE